MEAQPRTRSYASIHQFLIRTYGKAPFCVWDSKHQSTKFEWANVTGKYTTELEDYLPMCPSCHRRFDFTEETRQKMSATRKGKPACNKQPVNQFHKGILVASYESVSQAAKRVNLCVTSISNNISGYSKTAGGFVWEKN